MSCSNCLDYSWVRFGLVMCKGTNWISRKSCLYHICVHNSWKCRCLPVRHQNELLLPFLPAIPILPSSSISLHPKEPNPSLTHSCWYCISTKKGKNAVIIDLILAPTDIGDMSSSNYIVSISFFCLGHQQEFFCHFKARTRQPQTWVLTWTFSEGCCTWAFSFKLITVAF